MLTFLPALMLQAAIPADAPPQPIPAYDETVTRIEANDAQLFWGMFEGCDPDSVAQIIHPDFRMLHDLAGMPASSGAQMLTQARAQCAAREEGGANEGYKNRRLQVPGSRKIQMLGSWGALEEGYHTFHELRQRPAGTYGPDDAGGPTWVQTGGARYLHVWQWMSDEGRYRLLESLSVDHAPAVAYPPE